MPTILQAPSSSDPAGDMIIAAGGTVSMVFAAGMVSADRTSTTAPSTRYRSNTRPRRATGLCAAVATIACQNEGLTLQPCQTPGATVFVIDTRDSTSPTYCPIVIGNNTDFVHPFAMTIHGDPGRQQLPHIEMQHLKGNPADVPLPVGLRHSHTARPWFTRPAL